jgi:hypothetical protein
VKLTKVPLAGPPAIEIERSANIAFPKSTPVVTRPLVRVMSAGFGVV